MHDNQIVLALGGNYLSRDPSPSRRHLHTAHDEKGQELGWRLTLLV